MSILKAVSIRLADNIALLATLQYHVEPGNRQASRYRWLARVIDINATRAKITELKQDQNRLDPWKWPDDPSWDGNICTKDSTNYVQAEWLRVKLLKLVDPEVGTKLLNGWKRSKDEYNLNAKYDTEGYLCTDGSVVSLLDFETLKTKVGQNLVKEQILKRKTLPTETEVKQTASEKSEPAQPQDNN